jgi:hypothetical protein
VDIKIYVFLTLTLVRVPGILSMALAGCEWLTTLCGTSIPDEEPIYSLDLTPDPV